MTNKRAFPQENGISFGIRPSRPQAELNSELTSFYYSWKSEYLKASVSYPNCYYVSTGGGTNVKAEAITVSEGHGYGMISVVLMAGEDKDAKSIFDGLFTFFREHPSDIAPELPSWQVLGKVGDHETSETFASATDGDLDVAYSLLLADNQWGSEGDINYREEAAKVIDAIYRFDIHPESKRILLGDWVPGDDTEEKYRNSTRPSDWMPAHFRAYKDFTGEDRWSEVIDTIYEISDIVADEKTGLLPDFVVNDTPVPAEPFFLENSTDGSFAANACRVPWRIGMDFIHHGSKESQATLTKLMNWLNEDSKGSIDGVCNGYNLNGSPIYEENFEPWGMYASPFMVASAVDKKFEPFLTSSWNYLVKFDVETGYYSNSITLLCLLAVSGNWWCPEK